MATIQHMNVRPPAVAGRFYPAGAAELRAAVRGYIDAALPGPDGRIRAIIGPHAGYAYCGPIAGAAYAAAASLRGKISRVVLIGPSHFVPFTGIAASSADAFATALGEVPVDRAAVELAMRLAFVSEVDEAHAREHGLEVHLPFLQETLGGEFDLVPFVIGDSSAEQVAELLDLVWPADDPATLLVVSSDLSHYHEYDVASQMDRATRWAIESLKPWSIGGDQACGRLAIQGLLTLAASRGLALTTLDLRNSGDTAGPRDRVVGYGAWIATSP